MSEDPQEIRTVYIGETWERKSPYKSVGRIARADDQGHIAIETDGIVLQYPRAVFFRDFKLRCEARR